MSYDFLKTPITYLKGVGPKRAELLQKELNIDSFGQMLEYYPFRYIDRTKVHKIKDISSDMTFVQLVGQVRSMETIGVNRKQRLSVVFEDDTGKIELVWFKGIKWIREKIQPNQQYLVFGRPTVFRNSFNIAHPDFEILISKEQLQSRGKFQPYYSSTEKLKNKGLNARGIEKIMRNLIAEADGKIPETLPDDLLQDYSLLSRNLALKNIHFPGDHAMLEKARKRLKFEELFFIQLKILGMKKRAHKVRGHVFESVKDNFNYFYANNLKFNLTNAQKRVIKEIRKDTADGYQMNRLLQGDVGSGKTLVALMSMLIALDNGLQASLMAPTEILAGQHFKTITQMLEGMDVNIRMLTGSSKKSERNEIHQGLQEGTVDILIGTHALIEDNVMFRNLGFVVIDEQHRFGVAQRAKLWKKNTIPPHVLVMTATPIPRTLAMTVYGDLDVSIIDELPPGRKPVKTYHFTDAKRLKVFAFMKDQINKGRQIYVVYPLINESQKLDLKDLMDGYESIAREFPLPDYAISIVHGQMKPEAKDYEMQRFAKGETQILVATTVIEVGVDIPNASVMVIENAERFGLSQLHQLRGRVGRGAEQSFCILMTKTNLTQDGQKRIATMVQSSDGFKVAEEDMKLRGPGDIEGTQQSGILDLKISDIVQDEKILKLAREKANHLLEQDPELKSEKSLPVRKYLKYSGDKVADWSRIS
ncbi:MAG: ATP-dependent DNA helicase RecG [Bacteroidales bacterium]|nr:ATP-dependent DNA helicase RecG [Bacteroidales bacterium]